MQYTGTVAMFNSQLRRDRLGGLQEEQRPANNMIQYDLPQKKSQGQTRRTHEPKRTSPSHHGRVVEQTVEARRSRLSSNALLLLLLCACPLVTVRHRGGHIRSQKKM